MVRLYRLAFCAALLALITCRGLEGVAPGAPLPIGTWGGDNAAAIVTDTLTHVHIACTFGNIPGRIVLDESKRFTMDGSYVLRAYPVYVGPELPATFSGSVSFNRLTFTVTVEDTVEKKQVVLGPVTVALGIDPKMGPCPVCAVVGQRSRIMSRHD